MQNNEKSIAYVAEYNEKIIGIMCGTINSCYTHFHNNYAELMAIYIDPEYQGLKLEDYLKFSNSNLEDFKKTLVPEANKRVGYRLVMDAVVEAEKLEVSDKELEDGIEEAAKNYGMKKEDFEKEIGSKDLFKYDLLMKKAMKVVTE